MSQNTITEKALFEPAGYGGDATQEVDDILGAVIDGRYEVVTRLGQGGMGFVYEARDLALDGREVVLKTLRPELVNNERTAERFNREAMMQARIAHENVIVVTGHGVTKDYGAYYVMERLVGQDLGALLKTLNHPLPVHRILSITKQVAAALGAAHANEIVHRDLKPENIFLTTKSDGTEHVKVLDFGLARMLDAGNKLTETGAVIGTPRYMAPEQCHGQKADSRADIYSLGLVMYEMLSGEMPYQRLSTYEILGKKMFDDVQPLSEKVPPIQVDPRIEAFVMRCLSKTRDARIRDGAAMGSELEILEKQLQSPVAPRAGDGRAVPKTMRISSAPVLAAPPPTGIRPPSAVPSAPGRAAASPTVVPAAPRKRARALWMAVAAFGVVVVTGLGIAGLVLFLTRTAAEVSESPSIVAPPAAPETPPTVSDSAPVAPVETAEAPAAASPAIHVRSEPPGAEVRHGERVIGHTPLELRVPEDVAEGDTVELSLAGYTTRAIRISAAVPTAHVRLHASP